ncbi:RICIN domain-containing protein [Halanaerobacter jeridensis]|uniref:Beta-glucanase (GH16 family) n=1 Tax=Halanaerobacter jeridensis TaxID=706427 RepID=A0A939BP96_9FIRM|nr:RICIN domain-containing protein [Halanaerobacter jeridensis]MBM7556747.1 beta-glucanase (GH16 family) [Halanaerobacter jeridensis]
MKKFRLLSLILILLLSISLLGCSEMSTEGQQAYNVSGVVEDQSGQRIVGAKLNYQNLQQSGVVKTNEAGKWQINNLNGPTKITLEATSDLKSQVKEVTGATTNLKFTQGITQYDSSQIKIIKQASTLNHLLKVTDNSLIFTQMPVELKGLTSKEIIGIKETNLTPNGLVREVEAITKKDDKIIVETTKLSKFIPSSGVNNNYLSASVANQSLTLNLPPKINTEKTLTLEGTTANRNLWFGGIYQIVFKVDGNNVGTAYPSNGSYSFDYQFQTVGDSIEVTAIAYDIWGRKISNVKKTIVVSGGNNNNQDTTETVTTFTGDRYYKIIAKHSGRALDVSGGSKDDGANIKQWDYKGYDNQQWRFENVGNGYYKIVAKHSNKVLDVEYGRMSEGTNVQQWEYKGYDHQQWRLEKTGNGYYKIIAQHSGQVLDVAGVSTDNGTTVHQWSYVGGENQQWKIEELNSDNEDNFDDGNNDSNDDYNDENNNTTQVVKIEAEDYEYMSGIETENCSEGGQNVGWINNGDWLSYRLNLATSGQYKVEYRVASNGGGGVINLEQNSGRRSLGRVDVPHTGGWQNWQTISHVVNLEAGQQSFGIGVPDGGYNINWIKFSKIDGQHDDNNDDHNDNNGQWRLVWSDEFNYHGLPDSSKWGYDVGAGKWGNNELQYYTENRSENARVENGKLIIEARRDYYGGRDYSSARLVTENKADWKYGRIEVRAKLPSGRGTWPAIWMLPTDWVYGGWPDSGEIDIMEHVGYNPTKIYGTVHTAAYNHMKGTQKSGNVDGGSWESSFHTYAIDWYRDRIDFFVDDNLYYSFSKHGGSAEWPFDQRFYLILNIAVGGDWGGVEGVDPNIWPQRMEVDYVRVYKQN